jgi:glycosyltransferase involved in cell wall biosynthesis
MPRVTVFMPVYNGSAHLDAAVQSILAQTYQDFEFLIIDDGSDDETPNLLEKIQDPRLRIVRNDANRGVPATRNRGLDLALGEYVAMIDSDDLAKPERLETQVQFLDEAPDHAVVGTWAREIDEHDVRKRVLRRPLNWKRLRARLLFLGTIRTPSAMGRLDVLRSYRFRSEFPVCSDSDYWVRVALEHRWENIPIDLIDYRIHSDSLTKSNSEKVKERKVAIARSLLELLGMTFDDTDLENHFKLRRPKRHDFDAEYIDWAEFWLRSLIKANNQRLIFPKAEFTQAAGERWSKLFAESGNPLFRKRAILSRMGGPLISYRVNHPKHNRW